MATLGVSSKITRFKEAFLGLAKEFTLRIERETMTTVLEIREKVDQLCEPSFRCLNRRSA
jgi:hypothetical protein